MARATSSEAGHRLHPVSLLFEVGRRLSPLLLPLAVFVLAARAQGWLWGVVAPVGVIVLGTILAAVVRYLRFSYRYGATELVIRSGLFTRNERRIPYERIQNLDAAQNPLHRIFDVAVVHVQTGGGVEPEASLRVLPSAALADMRARVFAGGGTAGAWLPESSAAASLAGDDAASTLDSPRTLLSLSPRELLLAGFIENRGMVLIFGTLALLDQTGAIGRRVERLAETGAELGDGVVAGWLGGGEVPLARGVLYLLAALLVVLLFIRLLSTLWALVRLYDFRLTRTGAELRTEYGLFTRVSATIPLRRVQSVIVVDALLHRLTGRRAVLVETAGGSAIEPGARQREAVAPIVPVEHVSALLAELQPGLDLEDAEWRPAHRRAFGRMLRGGLAAPLALSLAAYPFVDGWALALFGLLAARALLRARLRARHLAWTLLHDAVAVRDGALTRATRVARFDRVQVAALGRNPFDLRTGMASVRADTAGARGGIVIPYLAMETAASLHAHVAARAAATAFTW